MVFNGDVEQAQQILRDYDVCLAPSYAVATAFNKHLALAGKAGAFGNSAITFNDWIAKLWEAHGDGRRLVSPQQRHVLASMVVHSAACNHLVHTPNLTASVAQLAYKGLGLPAFSKGRTATRLSPAEVELLACVDEYAQCLEQRGLIEMGQMLCILAACAESFTRKDGQPLSVYILDDAGLPYQQQWFFEACGNAVRVTHEVVEPQPLPRVADSLSLKFAFPAGDYAQPQALLDAIVDCFNDGGSESDVHVNDASAEADQHANGACAVAPQDAGGASGDADLRTGSAHPVHPAQPVVVAAKNALALYNRLSNPLRTRGITAAARGKINFFDTGIGQMYKSMRNVLRTNNALWDKNALIDVLHAPYVGLKKHTVWAWDAYVRSDRLVDRDVVLDWLENDVPSDADTPSNVHGKFTGFTHIHRLASNPFDKQVYADISKRLVFLRNQHAFSAAYIEEQFAALAALQQGAETIRQMHLDEEEYALETLDLLLNQTKISIARTTAGTKAGQAPEVIFCDQRSASALMSKSVETLIVSDLTTESYPLKDQYNAADALLARLGIEQSETALSRERRRFVALLNLPMKGIVFERTLNNTKGEERYPCAMFEELIDAYRSADDIARGDDIDNAFRLPAKLQKHIAYRPNEDKLVANIEPDLDAQLQSWADDKPLARETLRTPMALQNAAFAYEPQDGQELDLVLSPTAIDAYRSCPYRYLVQRRLKTKVPDEDFGPRSMGSFLHRILQDFYTEFGRKITPENLDEARAFLLGSSGSTSIGSTGGNGFSSSGGNSIGNGAEEYGTYSSADGLFGRIVAAQYTLKPGHRYAAIPGTTEEAQYDYARTTVAEWLDFETTFLPGFQPAAFELKLDHVPFGGCKIFGFADRLDVDPRTGNAIVIDYKGKLKSQYHPLDVFRFKVNGWKDDGYIQTAIYAALLNKLIAQQGPLHIAKGSGRFNNEESNAETVTVNAIVGALYVSYYRGNEVVGAYDSLAIGEQDIPTFNRHQAGRLAHDGEYSFPAFLELVEQRVREVAEGITAGRFEPYCIDQKDACGYCPVAKTCGFAARNEGAQ